MRRTFGNLARAISSAVLYPARRKPTSSRVESPTAGRRRYPGDFTGKFTPHYAAKLDGNADPGEVLWTWVPYEDDPSQGKDRPVLAIGEHRGWLLCLMLTSKDHDREDGPILALAGVVLVRNPRPQDFARVGIAVKLCGVARRELAREVTGVAAAARRGGLAPRR